MPEKLPESVLAQLQKLEPQLRSASKRGDYKRAHASMVKIQKLFLNNRSHFRVLQAKNWYYQTALEENKIDYATDGFKSIRVRANENTRVYLEATIFLGICHLRSNKISEAKEYIRETILKINNVKSDIRRNQLQKRIIDRVEFECILGQLRDEAAEKFNPKELHKKAIQIIKNRVDHNFGHFMPIF